METPNKISGKVRLHSPSLVRRPLLSVQELNQALYNFSDPRSFLGHAEFMFALQISVPNFYKKIRPYISKPASLPKTLLPTLQKYFLRASGHCIPRSLFAGYYVPGDFSETQALAVVHCRTEEKQEEVYFFNPQLRLQGDELKCSWLDEKSLKESHLTLSRKLITDLKKYREKSNGKGFQKKDFIKGLNLNFRLGSKIWEVMLEHGVLLKTSTYQVRNSSYVLNDPALAGYKDSLSASSNCEAELQFFDSFGKDLNIELSSREREEIKTALQLYTVINYNNLTKVLLRKMAADFFQRFESSPMGFYDFIEWYLKTNKFQNLDFIENEILHLQAVRNYFQQLCSYQNIELSQKQAMDFISQMGSGDLFSEMPVLKGHLNLQRTARNMIHIENVMGGEIAKQTGRHSFFCKTLRRRLVEGVSEDQKKSKVQKYQIVLSSENRQIKSLLRPLSGYDKNLLINHLKTSKDDIFLEDLLIASDRGSFYFINRQSGCRIQPVFTNMYNWQNHPDPVYKILGLLTQQSELSFNSFGNEMFGNQNSWPRVKLGNCILVPRRWVFTYLQLQHFKNQGMAHVQDFFRRQEIPQDFFLVTKDQKMPFRHSSDASMELLMLLMDSKNGLIIEESLDDISENSKLPYLSRTLIPFEISSGLFGKESSKKLMPVDSVFERTLKNPFEDQIYLRIFAPPNRFDRIIDDLISPVLTAKMDLQKRIGNFFIRYEDADGYHIRLRLFNPGARGPADFKNFAKLLKKLTEGVHHQLIEGFDIQPYELELNRYKGPRGVEIFERHSIFQTEAVFQILKQRKSNLHFEESKHLWVLLIWTEYLNIFFPDTAAKKQFLQKIVYGVHNTSPIKFSTEMQKYLGEMSVKFASEKMTLEIQTQFQKEIKNLFNFLTKEKIEKESVEDFLRSILHLWVNRLGLELLPYETEYFRWLLRQMYL